VQHTRASRTFSSLRQTDGDRLSSLLNPTSTLSFLHAKPDLRLAKTTPYSSDYDAWKATSAVPLFFFWPKDFEEVAARHCDDAVRDTAETLGGTARYILNRLSENPKPEQLPLKTFGTSCAVCGSTSTGVWCDRDGLSMFTSTALSVVAQSTRSTPERLRPVCRIVMRCFTASAAVFN